MAQAPTRRRWLLVALLFGVTFVAYMDRVNFSVSVPDIQRDAGFSLQQIGYINFAWALAYAVFNFPGGWVADRLGLRWGLVGSVLWWSVFTVASPFAGGLFGWLAVRALMGAGEAPIWSYTAKAADDWVAADERSTAYSLAGSGEFLGPALGAIAAGWIASTLGWRWSFVIFGVAGALLMPFWAILVRNTPEEDPAVNRAERARIGRHRRGATPDWAGLRAVVLSRTGLGILITYVANGYVLYTFKNWMPAYMHETFGSSVMAGAAWSGITSALGFVGFMAAGPVNDWLVRRTDRLRARRLGTAVPTAVAVAALLLSVWTAHAGSAWATAGLIGLAQFMGTVTAGAWAVSVIDLSPSEASTGLLYGFYNGALNLMGAVNGVAVAFIADRLGFPVAFGSTVVFLLLMVAGMVMVVDRPSYERLIGTAEAARS